MNKNIKRCLVFLLILFITVSVVNAENVTDDSNIEEESSVQIDQTTEQTSPDNSYLENNEKNIVQSSNSTVQKGKTIIINSTTFDDYVTDNYFNDKVNDGDTLDFQGLIFGTRFSLNVNKSVNIISSTKDAYFGNDGLKKYDGNDKENYFIIRAGGSGTNITGVYFYNTHVVTSHANNVNIDNITVEANVIIGSGQGVTSIRDFSTNISVKNSYFFSDNNGGISTLVCAGAENVLIDNCTVRARYFVGNLVYYTTFNTESGATNKNVTLQNTLIDASETVAQSICCPLVLQGSNHKIINNTIINNVSGELTIMSQMVMDENGDMVNDDDDVRGNFFINNTVTGNASLSNAKVSGNKFDNLYVRNSIASNNSMKKAFIRVNNTFFNNEAVDVEVSGDNNVITANEYVSISVNDTAQNNTIENNTQWKLLNESELVSANNTLMLDSTSLGEYSNIYLDLDTYDNIKILSLNNISDKNIKVKSSGLYGIAVNNSNLNIVSSNIEHTLLSVQDNSNVNLINSTILGSCSDNNSQVILTDSFMTADGENYYVISEDNGYQFNSKEYSDCFDNLTHKLLDSISDDSYIIVRSFSGEGFNQPMIINRRIHLIGMNNDVYNGEITFVEGSEQSVISNMTLNNNLNIKTSDISVVNNVINGKLSIENSLNTKVINNSVNCVENALCLNNSTKSVIRYNNISTTCDYAICLYNLSEENIVEENYLISDNKKSGNTVLNNGNNNLISNNDPKENVSIALEINNKNILNTESDINITVTSNNKTVTRGRVVILSNGIEKLSKELVEGNLNTTIILDETGTNKLSVFYFADDLYNNLFIIKEVQVSRIKSNLTLTVNEGKLCENSTVTAQVIDEYGNSVSQGSVTFTLGDINQKLDLNDGIAEITFLSLEEYNGQTLTAFYNGTESIENNTVKVTFKALKGESFITLTEEKDDTNTTITATVKNKLGENLIKGFLQFTGPSISKIVKVESNETKISITTPSEDTTIAVTFRNNPNYENTNSSITLYAKKNTVITLNELNPVYNTETKISGTLSDEKGNLLSNQNIRLIVDNSIIDLVTEDGLFEYTTVFKNVGQQSITAVYDGFNEYQKSESNITFNVEKQDVTVTVDEISEAAAGTNVTITGRFMDANQKAISNSNVRLYVNGEKYYAKTDKTGVYVLSVLVTKVGVNNMTAGYGGNAKYNEFNVNTTFTVGKQDVIVTYDPIMEVPAGTNVTITGKFTDNLGKAITNSNVRLYVNGVKYFARTDKTGSYTLSVLVTKVGVNNLTYGYAGSAKYNEFNADTTFNAGKQDVIVTVDDISEVNAGNNVTITGHFTDNLGKALSNSNVRLYVNGVKYFAKTDKTGKYTLSVLVTKVGVNNLTAGYAGNTKYNEYNINTTFNVGKQDVIVTIDEINEVKAGTNATITGTFTDNLGKAITNSNVRLFVNGVKYFAKTDKTGRFTLSVLVTKVGINNLTYGYAGSTKYNEYNVDTTFSVGKQDVIVTYNKISDVKVGQNVTITGKFTDNLGKAITNSNVKIILNGTKYFARTDKTGTYIFTTMLNKEGTYNVTVGYGGSTKYNSYETSTTFKVINN